MRAGGRIVYAPAATAITEAPESAKALFRQRFRWSFGTLQSLWKHRQALGRGTVGWVALPNILLFQVLFPLLCPLGDLVFLLALLRGLFLTVGVTYLIFLVVDLVGSVIAFRLDGRRFNGLWAVMIQRLYYRQFMYCVTGTALVAALRGGRHGWNKLDRKATVSTAINLTPPLPISHTVPPQAAEGCG
ncbi:MAG: hypothetical protein DME26_01900 [Verrucomicrobia bacterium]|nr:MAG: hypothetical protein DME26_01900 [Verrucomicrobiota bacterium]